METPKEMILICSECEHKITIPSAESESVICPQCGQVYVRKKQFCSKLNKDTADAVARMSLDPIMERFKQRAKDLTIDTFCQPRCGHTPDPEFCPKASNVYRGLLSQMIQRYTRLN